MTAMRKFWTAVLLLPFMFLLVLLGSGMHYVLYERKQRAELAEQIKRYQIEFSPAQDRSATAAVEDDVVRDGDEEEEDPCEGLTLLRVDELRLLISEFYHVRPTDSEVAHIAWQCEPKHLPEGMEHLNSVLPPRPACPRANAARAASAGGGPTPGDWLSKATLDSIMLVINSSS